MPSTTTHFTVFGYGLDREALPRTLLDGDFTVRASSSAGEWQMLGRATSPAGSRVAVDGGDSGGPGITQPQDDKLGQTTPEVCFVASAVQTIGAFDPALRRDVTRLQPVWDLDRRMVEPLGGAKH
jgi:hypothetical protein